MLTAFAILRNLSGLRSGTIDSAGLRYAAIAASVIIRQIMYGTK